MTYQNIIVETRDRTGLIRLNRPQRMNALNDALAVELKDALERFDDIAEITPRSSHVVGIGLRLSDRSHF